ncbi:hypothetical protein BH09DEP1_BH09DEP1_3110 [soil metagenome]
MQLKTVLFFLFIGSVNSFSMEQKRTRGLRRTAALSSKLNEDVPESITPNPFDFTTYYLEKFTQTVTKSDGTQETVFVRVAPMDFRPDHIYSTLHEAALANDPKGIERLLAVSRAGILNAYNPEGQTPLQCAVDHGCSAAIACLIKHGARADMLNQNGEYNSWTLAKAYFESKTFTNVVSFMALEDALAQNGQLGAYKIKKPKTVLKAKKLCEGKPSRIIRLRRQIPREPTPELGDGEFDPYLLNV